MIDYYKTYLDIQQNVALLITLIIRIFTPICIKNKSITNKRIQGYLSVLDIIMLLK